MLLTFLAGMQIGFVSAAILQELRAFATENGFEPVAFGPNPLARASGAPPEAVWLAPHATTADQRTRVAAELVASLVESGVVPRAKVRNELQVWAFGLSWPITLTNSLNDPQKKWGLLGLTRAYEKHIGG